jgi:hypothetical protein
MVAWFSSRRNPRGKSYPLNELQPEFRPAVLSPLASNAFTIGFGMCFSCKDVLGKRGVSKKLRVFS